MSWWLTLVLAIAFGAIVMPIAMFGAGAAREVATGDTTALTVRVPPFAGYPTRVGRIGGNGAGVLIAAHEVAGEADAINAHALADALPHGPAPYFAVFAIVAVLAGLFSHHAKRSTRGRLVRTQVTSLALIVAAAIVVKLAMLVTAISILAVPVAAFALIPTLALDRVVGLATATLAALVMSLLVPFDVGVAILLLVQTSVAGLVVAERPKQRMRAALVAGGIATLLAAVAYPLVQYLTTGQLPIRELGDPSRSAWIAAMFGPAVSTLLALVLVPAYQLLVGEISRGRLIELGELTQPLLKQIADKAPGTWQHSLMMANLAEIAANAIGADARLVRVGALYHDLGKSLHPKYFIENLEPGEVSPHDQLPPEASCEAIFGHVTEGLEVARKHGLHERLVDFMHMHHGDGVLEYFWAKCQTQGNPKGLTVANFRYPGVPPQSRETAILAICDAVEAASRTIKKPEATAIASLVQRIVYGKLHLGQLDESGLSMRDLREIADSLRETIRAANHGRIEYPWQQAEQSASAAPAAGTITTAPALDSLDRSPGRPSARPPTVKPQAGTDAFAITANVGDNFSTSSTTQPASQPPPELETPRLRQLKVSKDGLPRVEHQRPSDGGIGGPIEASTPVVIDGEPDTGKHRAAKAAQDSAQEIAEFTADAKRALDAAARDIDVLPPDRRAQRERDLDTSAAVRRAITEAEPSEAIRRREPSDPPPPVARKRAATLPPIAGATRPQTGMGRRAPTVPPPAELRRPSSPSIAPIDKKPAMLPATTLSPSTELRRPSDGKLVTGPMPQLEIIERRGDSVSPPITLPKKDDAAITRPRIPVQAAITQPSMLAANLAANLAEDDTEPSIPSAADTAPSMPAAMGSDPAITLPPPPPMPSRTLSWSDGLAARVDAKLDGDFGTDTPVIAPTRAELQALRDVPPDATRELSFEEVERLHRQNQRELRRSEPELEFTRRAHYPTAEVREEDIEAAIEIAPAPRRTGAIGIAKTKKPADDS
ncbi:MAG TPA: HDIG domain-containing protein [Kofleriaceae bacterium]|nr:HDIG domain-containing protein [Kofleriaceae bacterium]